MSELHALLIGIDAYLPNEIAGVGYYPRLEGCVQDVIRVEGFLRSRGLSPERLHKLTASTAGNGSTEPAEPKEQWPTYEKIVSAFKQLTATANPGDRVYIHYSGHGNQAKTAYPDLKEKFDEVLVPVDIGDSETRYLRDIELAHLLREMVDRGLLVTLVLDSCHSGGATRGVGEVARKPRGIRTIDTSERRTDSLVASKEELVASWPGKPVPGGVMIRNFQADTGWLPAPTGYVLIAACTPKQTAFECAFEGDASSGALTHFLLEALAGLSPGATYETLHNRLLATVQSDFPGQTPMIVGESRRLVLTGEETRDLGSMQEVAVVLGGDENGRLRLNTGQAQGVLNGARFAVYPPDAYLVSPGAPLAEVEIVQYGGTESLAEVKGSPPSQPIASGSRAVLLDPGPNYRGASVRLAYRSAPAERLEKEVLVAVADLIAGSPYLQLVGEGEAADFQVAVNDRHEIEIQDAKGVPWPHLRPAILAPDPEAASTAVERLIHLAKYQAVRQLENPDAPSALAEKFVVELLAVQDTYDLKKKPNPLPRDERNVLEMIEGQWTFLRISNHFPEELNVAVLDLQPDWGISQVHPGKGEKLFPLGPAESFDLPLQAQLPAGIEEGTDVLKVFATRRAADFRFLELPALDKPDIRLGTRTFVTAPPPSPPEWYGTPHTEWVTAQVEVKMRRRPS